METAYYWECIPRCFVANKAESDCAEMKNVFSLQMIQSMIMIIVTLKYILGTITVFFGK